MLLPRPHRPSAKLDKYPPSEERVLKPVGCKKAA